MKSTIKIIFTAALLGLCTLNSSAQDIRASYFVDGSTYRHRMNPAFINESNYINLPFVAINNFTLGVNSNLGLGKILFPGENGQLMTFMHPSVSSSEFLKQLNRNNRINADLGVDLISFGFFGVSRGFNTFEVGIKSNTSVNLPYGLFDFMKNGMSNTTGNSYDMSGIRVTTNNYLHLTYGYSRYIIKDMLSFGAKIRVMAGLANADLNINKLNANVSGEKWTIEGSGNVVGNVPGAELISTTDEQGSYVSNIEFDDSRILENGIPGYGWSCDLGVFFDMSKFVKGLALSASITDLGKMTWNNSMSASMDNKFEFSGFEQPLGEDISLDDELNQMGEDLAKFARFQDDGIISTRESRLSARMYVGAEYRLPVYDKLKFGILSTTVFNNPTTWSEIRGAVVFSPGRSFDITASYAYGPFGQSIGWMMNVHPNGFNFFIAGEYGISRLSPQFIPIDNINVLVNFGMTITWGKNKIAKEFGKM